MSILVVGSVAYDTIKTPSKTVERALGGSAVYFSTVASYFTGVQLVGVAGKDFNQEDLSWLKSRKVDISGLQIADGKTFHWSGSYNDSLTDAQTHSTDLNVFQSFNPQLTEQQKKAEFIFLANIDPDLQLSVLAQIENPTLTVMDTMNFWITSKLDRLTEVLKKVDVLILNDTEARMLTGEAKVVTCGEKLLSMGPRRVLIKLGEFGAMSFYQTDRAIVHFFAPTYPTKKIIDPTGAGDSFAGGFVGYLAASKRTDEEGFRLATVYGGVMASLTVEDFSINRYKSLKMEEIDQRIDYCHQLAHFDLTQGRVKELQFHLK